MEPFPRLHMRAIFGIQVSRFCLLWSKFVLFQLLLGVCEKELYCLHYIDTCTSQRSVIVFKRDAREVLFSELDTRHLGQKLEGILEILKTSLNLYGGHALKLKRLQRMLSPCWQFFIFVSGFHSQLVATVRVTFSQIQAAASSFICTAGKNAKLSTLFNVRDVVIVLFLGHFCLYLFWHCKYCCTTTYYTPPPPLPSPHPGILTWMCTQPVLTSFQHHFQGYGLKAAPYYWCSAVQWTAK